MKSTLKTLMRAEKINLNFFEKGLVGIALNEATTSAKLQKLANAFARFKGVANIGVKNKENSTLPADLLRR